MKHLKTWTTTNGLKVVLGLTAFTLAMGVADSAPASLRYRVSGSGCIPWTNTTNYTVRANAGFELRENSGAINADIITCAIPLGPDLVDLGDGSGHPLDQINLRLRQEDTSATVATFIRVHDHDAASSCTCGSATGSMAAGTFAQRAMTFDCGSCAFGTDWGAAVDVIRTGAGTTQLRLVSVYD